MSSSWPSGLRIIDPSCGSDSGVWTLETMPRRSWGALGLVIQEATVAMYKRSPAVSPPWREKEMVVDPADTSLGNARSSAVRAWMDSALAGRKELWSVDPTCARDGASASAAPAATIQTTRMAKR